MASAADQTSPRIIIALPGNEAFARDLARAGAGETGALETRDFPDGETYVRLASDVTGRRVLLVSTLARPNEGFLRLVFLADAARSLGAAEVTLVAPYLAYMRQDRRFQPGEAVTSRTFARLISSSFDRIVTVDPHLHRYPALSALYDIPALTLHAAPLLADWIASSVARPLVIGPDEESEQWVSAIAARIDAPHAVLRKVRHGDRDVEIDLPDLSRWNGLQPVLVDDIVSSGNTLIQAARKLPQQGFARPDIAVVHGIFAGDSFARLASLCGRIVSTDAVRHPSNAIGLARLIAEAITADVPGPELIRRRRPPEPLDEVGRDAFPAGHAPPAAGGGRQPEYGPIQGS